MLGSRIAIAIHLAEMMNHFRGIIRALPPGVVIVDCAAPGSDESLRLRQLTAQEGGVIKPMSEVPTDTPSFDVVISNQMHVIPWVDGVPGLCKWAPKQIRLCYGLGKTEWNFSDWNRFYDLILCFGPYQQALFQYAFPDVEVQSVGYPRFDNFAFFPADRSDRILSFGGDPGKKVVVWLPTYGKLSSIQTFAGRIAELNGAYNVLVKVHPGTPMLESEQMALLRSCGFTILIADDFDNVRLFEIADFVLVDYGGSAFGAIYTDRNFLLLNSPGDLFAEDTGWLSADIQLRDDFISISPDESFDLHRLLADTDQWRRQSEVRKLYRELLFSDRPGHCGRKAAKIVVDFVSKKQVATIRKYEKRFFPESLLKIRNLPDQSPGYPWRSTYLWVKGRLAASAAELKKSRESADEAQLLLKTREKCIETMRKAQAISEGIIEQSRSELAQLRSELDARDKACAVLDENKAHIQADLELSRNESILLRKELRTRDTECRLLAADKERIQAELERLRSDVFMLKFKLEACEAAYQDQLAKQAVVEADLKNSYADLTTLRVELGERDKTFARIGTRFEVRLGNRLRSGFKRLHSMFVKVKR